MRSKRRKFTPEEKVQILKKHFVEKKAISDLCDEYNIHPNLFYKWQKEFFDNAVLAFKKDKDKKERKLEKRIEFLQKKLADKNEVLSELMQEHIALKKSLGEI